MSLVDEAHECVADMVQHNADQQFRKLLDVAARAQGTAEEAAVAAEVSSGARKFEALGGDPLSYS